MTDFKTPLKILISGKTGQVAVELQKHLAGLVVHGPLMATLSLRAFCRANPQAQVRRFAYRGVRPLIAPQPFDVGGRVTEDGVAQLWAGNADGLAQQAHVHFE